ncbi:MAG TPA: ABC transporter ATP-binding protein [Actinotalea caeni]|uniref:ABC transporter ATP-binding protein n=1 Tax=Actinotalea caeni TaxID=1348467 RepID=UPI002B4AFBDC|nr:ABC transporter ATP-binding protein [Actinotalea caeni]HLV55830.1 ABC transporter ATP-binding protein [Actinotalea caeni]
MTTDTRRETLAPTASSAEPVVAVDGVRRTFGDVVALDGVSLAVRPGEIVGLLGPNGAGKSTLLSLVTGQRKPDAGTVRLFGQDPRLPAARIGLGVTPQETGLPPSLTVGEVVDLVSGHYPDPMPRAELLERFDLADLARRQTGGLSGGQKRRLAVALSLAGRPRLVLLDEPTTGLDVEGRRALWQAVRDYHREGATVVVTSHYLEEIEALAERVVVIGSGRVLADDTLGAVVARVQAHRVAFRSTAAAAELAALPGVTSVEVDGDRRTLLTSDSDALVRRLVVDGVPFTDLEVRGASLEEAFLALTEKEAA